MTTELNFLPHSKQKVVRHLVREASKVGFSLSGVNRINRSAKSSLVDQSCASEVGDAFVALEFQQLGQSGKESVLIGELGNKSYDCLTYKGKGRKFLKVIADVQAYCRQTDLQQQLIMKYFQSTYEKINQTK